MPHLDPSTKVWFVFEYIGIQVAAFRAMVNILTRYTLICEETAVLTFSDNTKYITKVEPFFLSACLPVMESGF